MDRLFGKWFVFGTLYILLGRTPLCLSGKILLSFVRVIHVPSNLVVLSPIGEALVDRGHEVVVLVSDTNSLKGLSPKAYSRVTYFSTPNTKEDVETRTKTFTSTVMDMSKKKESLSRKLTRISLMRSVFAEGCDSLFQDTQTLEALKAENFDIMVTLTVVGCDVLLASYLEIPFALFTFSRRLHTVSEDLFGIPIPSSYVPYSLFSSLTNSMTFKERVKNVIQRFVVHRVLDWYLTRPIVEIKDKMDIRPDLSLRELMGRAALWLRQTSSGLEFSQPTAPMVIPVGGIAVKNPSALPDVGSRVLRSYFVGLNYNYYSFKGSVYLIAHAGWLFDWSVTMQTFSGEGNRKKNILSQADRLVHRQRVLYQDSFPLRTIDNLSDLFSVSPSAGPRGIRARSR